MSWDGVLDRVALAIEISASITSILSANMSTNPSYQEYKIIFEQLQKRNSMCILLVEVISKTLKPFNNSSRFSIMDVLEFVYNFTQLFDIHTIQTTKIHIDYYIIGNICRQTNILNNLCKSITFQKNGLNVNDMI